MGTHSLPTVEQLARLPLRAIAAYAARVARRVERMLHGVADDRVVEEGLSILERVVSSEHLDEIRPDVVLSAAARLTGEAIPLKGRLDIAMMAVESAVYAASGVVRGADEPNRMSYYVTLAAKAADMAARRMVAALDDPKAVANAAWRDYETLVRTSGEHNPAVVGEPIDLSEESFWGTFTPDVICDLPDVGDRDNSASGGPSGREGGGGNE